MERTKIASLLASSEIRQNVLVKGWVRTRRDVKTFSFIEVNDGSCLKNLQVIADEALFNYSEIKTLTTGSAISITGALVESQGKGQNWELRANAVDILSLAPDSYPLQKKRHTDEFLRSIAHLRPRTNKYGAAFRIRSTLAFAIHRFFQEKDFFYIHTPVITGSDCEGAGELFRVTTIDPQHPPVLNGAVDYGMDFFGAPANLTVSGQLSVEMFALSLGDVYTFGPTFRAENSNTRRHASEFWMIEPEMAFYDLNENIALAESFIRDTIAYIMDHCAADVELFGRFVDKSLMSTLEGIVTNDFVKLPYEEAVSLLLKSKEKFTFDVAYGKDLQSEHERYLTETYFKKPVIVINYPKEIKPFYMRVNNDEKTVAAMDLLVPNIGEIIGGSQREERLSVLEARMEELGIQKEPYWWYLDSRRFGSVVHSGFGLGFERLLMLITGIHNIRDVIPFPRTPKHIDF